MKRRIETPRLVLRRFAAADAGKVFRMSREDSLRAWIPDQVYRDEAHAAAVLAFLISQYDDPGDPRVGPYVLGVELRQSGELIGHVGFSPFHGEVEVGYAIEKAHQGRGLAAEAVRAACEWALREFRLPAVLGVAAARNVASQGVLRRAGFERQREEVTSMQGVRQPAVFFTFTA